MPAKKRPRNGGTPDPRRHLTAYLQTQELHRQIHRCTRAFEEQSTDDEIKSRLIAAQALLEEILEILQ